MQMAHCKLSPVNGERTARVRLARAHRCSRTGLFSGHFHCWNRVDAIFRSRCRAAVLAHLIEELDRVEQPIDAGRARRPSTDLREKRVDVGRIEERAGGSVLDDTRTTHRIDSVAPHRLRLQWNLWAGESTGQLRHERLNEVAEIAVLVLMFVEKRMWSDIGRRRTDEDRCVAERRRTLKLLHRLGGTSRMTSRLTGNADRDRRRKKNAPVRLFDVERST
jgi:hypothetical protein